MLRPIPPRQRARDRRISLDSRVYIAATQALAVGAGRPAVRAAAIKALSTLAHVSQARVRLHGIPALRVDFPDHGSSEIIWLDASSGVPIQERDAGDSATAFLVERVTAAHLPRRLSGRAQLR
jgi:hypothetical protein